MNRILSYELGRTAITLDNVTCKNPWRFSTQDPAAAFVELGNILLNSEEGLSSLTSPEERRQRVTDCLTRLAEMPRDYLMLNASIADITFCIYRRLRIANQVISKEELKQVIDLGKSSIMAVRTLVEKNQPWWQILNTTFQFLCVLISIDSPEASAEIKEVLQTLEMVMNRYNTHLASEALETAKLLVHALKEKKRRELALLDECDNVVTPSSGNTVLLDDYNPFLAGEPLSLDPPLDFDWNFLFDPHIG
ncbi:MAG: hypothetical protein M1828_001978 [Chrysothrix sp. TS-e1954]|nr:MAG: hypothetical protein M1828_001978 [Chrysothrix sp. TS-e1954]